MPQYVDPRILALIALIVVNVTTFLLLYFYPTLNIKINIGRSSMVVGSTLAVMGLIYFGTLEFETFFVLITSSFLSFPWYLLVTKFHQPSTEGKRLEFNDFTYAVILWIASFVLVTPFYFFYGSGFPAAYSVVFGLHALFFWLLVAFRDAGIRALDAAEAEAERKRETIHFMVECSK